MKTKNESLNPEKEIERLVNTYSQPDNKELFKIELERLIILTRLDYIRTA